MKNLNAKIRTIKLIVVSSILIFALMPSASVAQINLKKIKDKVSGNKSNNQSNNQNSNQSNNQNQSNVQGNISSNKKESDNFSELSVFYAEKASLLKQYPFVHYNFGQLDWDENSIKTIEEFDMPATLSKMEQDKQKYPKLFMIYPKTLPTGGMNVMTKADIPSIAVKAGENEDFPYQDDDARKVNQFYQDYMFWKSVSLTKQRDVAQVVNKLIINAETAMTEQKIDKSNLAIRGVIALKSIQPENPMIGDMEKRAKQTLDNSLSSLGDIITGEMHKANYKKMVGFSVKPQIGKESTSTITNEITPGRPFYLVGYLPAKIKDLDLKGHVKGVPVAKTPVLEWKQVGTDNNFGRMQMYWNQNMMNIVKEQSYYIFEMFPDINMVNFKSHVEYIPIMNFVKWLTYQMPGEYQFYFQFSTGGAVSTLADNTFTIKLTNESISELKSYYDKLAQKKLLAVTFNDGAGCTDNKATIGGKDNMKKYGEVIKLTCAQTGQVMKPWPNENQVEYFTGAGYGVFKRTDGKYEIIKLDFRKSPGSSQFDFSGANVMSHYEIEGSITIKSEVLNLGYEISKEGIDKCTIW